MIGIKGLRIQRNKLVSPSRYAIWDGAELRADAQPSDGNSSGIYAVYDIPQAATYSDLLFVVEGWGAIARGTSGFRSEYARAIACYPMRPLKMHERDTLDALRIPVLSSIIQIHELAPRVTMPREDGVYLWKDNAGCCVVPLDGADTEVDDVRRMYIHRPVKRLHIEGRNTTVKINAHVDELHIHCAIGAIEATAPIGRLFVYAEDTAYFMGSFHGSTMKVEAGYRIEFSVDSIALDDAILISDRIRVNARYINALTMPARSLLEIRWAGTKMENLPYPDGNWIQIGYGDKNDVRS